MNTIHILLKKIDPQYLEENYEMLLDLLYRERKEKVQRLKNRKAAYVSLTAGMLLQETVEKCLGIPPEKLCLEKTKQGKPYLADREDFFFNLSHSGEFVALAYGETSVGIDIEQIRKKDRMLAKRCFCEEEYRYICEGKTEEEQNRRFFEIWTMKESYLKCMGTGINVPLNSFLVHPKRERIGEFRFQLFEHETYILAICAEKPFDVRWESGQDG